MDITSTMFISARQ